MDPAPFVPSPKKIGSHVHDHDHDDDDDDDECMCIPISELLESARKRTNNPDLTYDQMYENSLRETRAIMAKPDDPTFLDRHPIVTLEDLTCRQETMGKYYPLHGNRLIITDLSEDTVEEDLVDAFCPYGEIVEKKIIKDRKTGQPMGFGFVSFATEQSMYDAFQAMNCSKLNGHIITVSITCFRGPPRGGPAELGDESSSSESDEYGGVSDGSPRHPFSLQTRSDGSGSSGSGSIVTGSSGIPPPSLHSG